MILKFYRFYRSSRLVEDDFFIIFSNLQAPVFVCVDYDPCMLFVCVYGCKARAQL